MRDRRRTRITEVRKKMGIESKKFVKKFYPETVVKRWYKLFRGDL